MWADFFGGVGQGVADVGDAGGRVPGRPGRGRIRARSWVWDASLGYADGRVQFRDRRHGVDRAQRARPRTSPRSGRSTSSSTCRSCRGGRRRKPCSPGTVSALGAFDQCWYSGPRSGRRSGDRQRPARGPRAEGRRSGAAGWWGRGGEERCAGRRPCRGRVGAGGRGHRKAAELITEVVGKVSARLRGLDVPSVALPHGDLPPCTSTRLGRGARCAAGGWALGRRRPCSRQRRKPPGRPTSTASGHHGEGDGSSVPEIAAERHGRASPSGADPGSQAQQHADLPPELCYSLPAAGAVETPLPARGAWREVTVGEHDTDEHRIVSSSRTTVTYFDDAPSGRRRRVVVVDRPPVRGSVQDAVAQPPPADASNFQRQNRAHLRSRTSTGTCTYH